MGAKTSASSLDSKLKKLVRKLKQEGNWPPKGGLIWLRDELKVGKPNLLESMQRLELDLSQFVKGSQTPAQAKAKEKLKILIATGDYPTDLDEIGKIVGIDTKPNQGWSKERGSTRQMLGLWMKELGVPISSAWDTKNWSPEKWDSWEAQQLEELKGTQKRRDGPKGRIPFSEIFNEATEVDQRRYLDAIKNRDYAGSSKKTEWYKSRNNITQKYTRLQKALLSEAKGIKGLEAIIDGLSPEQVEKVIESRGRRNFQTLQSRADVYSWDTVDGTENGKLKPGTTKKKVGTLLVATADDLVKMEQLAIQMVRDQVTAFYRTGTMPKIKHMDHIFPSGSPRIVNGRVYGGAVDNLGNFQGFGLTTYQNMRELAAVDNMSRGNILSDERIKELFRREKLEGKNVLSVDESIRLRASQTDAQARTSGDRALRKHLKGEKTRRRYGGAALGTFAALLLAPWSEKGYTKEQFEETASDPWYWLDNIFMIDTKSTVENPKRLLYPERVVYRDIIRPTAQMVAQGLRSRDPTEDEYAEAASMGSPQGLLGEGHPGLQDRSPMDTYGGRRKKNIWG